MFGGWFGRSPSSIFNQDAAAKHKETATSAGNFQMQAGRQAAFALEMQAKWQ